MIFFVFISESREYLEAVEKSSFRVCHSWEYDTSFWKRTIIQEWDLVIDLYFNFFLTLQLIFSQNIFISNLYGNIMIEDEKS